MPYSALTMSLGERAAYGARMLLIGMGTIFCALLVLWIALVVFRRLLEYFDPQIEEPVPALPNTTPDAAQDELIAVITAAVAAAMADENGGTVSGFRVVSFSKVPTFHQRSGRID